MMFYLSLIKDEEDQSKFTDLYNEYCKLMHYVANKILRDASEAEDVVHDSFIKIIEILPQIKEIKSERTKNTVLIIVERQAIDIYRKRRRHPDLSYEDTFFNTPATEWVEGLDTQNEIVRALLQLSDRSREILLLKYHCGYSEKEIATILSMSYDAVRKNIQRAREQLQKILTKNGLTPEND